MSEAAIQRTDHVDVDAEALAKVHGIPAKYIEQTLKCEAIAARCSPEALAKMPQMVRALVLGKGMYDLRKAMDDDMVKTVFMPLQGSKLGFRTDKDQTGGYPVEIVRECVIESLIRGLQPVGNHWNIIGSNCYTTQEGFDFKVANWPGLTNLELMPSVPVMKDGGALVAYEARWMINGKPDFLVCAKGVTKDGEEYDHRIPVRVNSGQIVDAIIGKARRKMLARIYERISGVKLPDGDVIDVEGETVSEAKATDKRARGTDAATEELINKHKGKGGKAKASADPAADSNGDPEPGANG